LSTTAAPREPTKAVPTIQWSLAARAIGFFSGTVGLALKIAFLAIVNAIAVWGAAILLADRKWVALAVLVLATIAIDVVYLSQRRTLALKFLVPGTVFLLGFQIAPILYNANVAFSNWSTGHQLTKSEAIEGIKRNSLQPPADGKAYLMAPARDAEGALVLVLVDEETEQAFIGSREGLTPLDAAAVERDDIGTISAVQGYRVLGEAELQGIDAQLTAYTVPTEGDAAIRPEALETALELEPSLQYDARRDVFVRVEDEAVFRDNGSGSFVGAGGEELEPGWRTNVGVTNFRRVVDDPLVRAPFLRVFVWTIAFATFTVLFSFSLGLFLAIALDRPGMRFQRSYRSLLVMPYAVPAFLSLLVWAGLLNDDFGVVNRLLHVNIPWLFDGNWAKVSILIVSTWLTFPYFFLVSMGALQSIPAELHEAARVDGGGAWQVFRKVTLPLLLVAVAPLMIASFAFNFNNFNNIYLLTGGGPASNDGEVAGATDILISYTWKLAFETGKGSDYGLASAISILIFFLVGTISALSFWRTKSLENMR
jgi:arabinogalactan oligomer / maltooligosaccharide transport system permease protein